MECFATLKSFDQQSSILVFTFLTDDDEELILFGDHRMCRELTEFVGQRLEVWFRSSTDWSWFTIEEPA